MSPKTQDSKYNSDVEVPSTLQESKTKTRAQKMKVRHSNQYLKVLCNCIIPAGRFIQTMPELAFTLFFTIRAVDSKKCREVLLHIVLDPGDSRDIALCPVAGLTRVL